MRGILVAVTCAVVVGGCYGSSGINDHGDTSTETTTGECGNGIVEAGEECDDGNEDDCDGCSNVCTLEIAMSIEGSMPAATVPDESSLCLNCPYTIEAWFRIDREGGVAPIFNQSLDHEFYVAADGYSIVTPVGGGGTSWHERLEAGTWHHAAAICFFDVEDGHWLVTAFVDGGHMGFASGWVGFPPTWTCDEPLRLGYVLDSWPGYNRAATIDDVRISSTVLYEYDYYADDFTPERELEVRPDTIAMWDFDHVVDGVILDISGHGHDAILDAGRLVADDCHLP